MDTSTIDSPTIEQMKRRTPLKKNMWYITEEDGVAPNGEDCILTHLRMKGLFVAKAPVKLVMELINGEVSSCGSLIGVKWTSYGSSRTQSAQLRPLFRNTNTVPLVPPHFEIRFNNPHVRAAYQSRVPPDVTKEQQKGENWATN